MWGKGLVICDDTGNTSCVNALMLHPGWEDLKVVEEVKSFGEPVEILWSWGRGGTSLAEVRCVGEKVERPPHCPHAWEGDCQLHRAVHT